MQFLLRKSVLFAASLGMMSVAVIDGPSACAQSATTGAIGGTVTDTGGALLPNTVVTVKSVDNGVTRTTKTTSSGDYKVDALQPGTYVVSYAADGFQTLQQTNVVVSVGNLASVSPKLTVGSVTDKVEVVDEAPEIKTAGAEIATTIDQNTIDNLPINGRRYSDFALLTPGVVSNSDGFGLLSFRGISYLLNNTTVDGADDNQAYFSEARGRTRSSYTVTQGAVQEFQVNTSNYSAEYGRAAGGVINTVTKSGSNQFHGEVYFYDRDNSLGGASNPYTQIYNFDEGTGLHVQNVKPKDKRYQYGFGVGGPILKDRVFWFYAFDQQKRNFPGVARTSDPYDLFQIATPLSGNERCQRVADAYGTYDFGAPTFGYTNPSGVASGGQSVTANLSTPATVLNPAALVNGSVYPVGESYEGNFGACALAAAIAPTTASGADLPYQQAAAYYNQGLGVMATLFGFVPRIGDQTINFPKVDWQINDRNRMTVQYNRLRWDSPDGIQTQTSNFDARGSYGNDFVKADVGVFRLSSVLTNTLVNQFLAQYGRDMETEFPSRNTPNELPLANSLPAGECSAPHGGPCPAEAPDLSVGYGYDAAGFDAGTSAILSRFALPDERRLQLKDDLTWSRGAHTIKFGVDYNKVSDYINNLYNGYGTYDYDWAYSFIGDYLHSQTNLGGTGYAGGGAYNGGDENLGLYSSFSQGFTVPPVVGSSTTTPAGASSLLTTREYAGYATDDWRITPRLTLTAGVRYEYQYVPQNPTPNPAFVGDPTTADGAYFAAAGVAVPNTLSHPDDRNNIAPRIGLAWNVYGTGKTVVRAGYGIYYGRIVNSNIEQTYQNSGGPNSQVNISGLFPDITTTSAPYCSYVFPAIVPTYQQAHLCAQNTSNASTQPSVSYLNSKLQNPEVYETDLNLQQDLGGGWIFDVTYMASFGRKLDSANNVNLSLTSSQIVNYAVNNTLTPITVKNVVALPHGGKPAPLSAGTVPVRVYSGARIDPNYYRVLEVSSNVNSSYNALAFQLNKRYKSGFSLLSNFTWSHALDFNPYIGTGIPSFSILDPNNQKEEYGNSSLDVRERFVAALVYEPQTHLEGWKSQALSGWRIAPEIQAQTGLPYTPYISGYPHESLSGVRSANGAGGTSGRIEEIRRNQYYKPKTFKADVRLSKNFYIPVNHYALDRLRLEFFAEVFNIANHQNITGVQNTAYFLSSQAVSTTVRADGYLDTLYLQPNFGTYNNSNSNYTYTPRQLQLAARIHF